MVENLLDTDMFAASAGNNVAEQMRPARSLARGHTAQHGLFLLDIPEKDELQDGMVRNVGNIGRFGQVQVDEGRPFASHIRHRIHPYEIHPLEYGSHPVLPDEGYRGTDIFDRHGIGMYDLISYPHALSVERHDAVEQGFVHVVDEQFVPTRGDE